MPPLSGLRKRCHIIQYKFENIRKSFLGYVSNINKSKNRYRRHIQINTYEYPDFTFKVMNEAFVTSGLKNLGIPKERKSKILVNKTDFEHKLGKTVLSDF